MRSLLMRGAILNRFHRKAKAVVESAMDFKDHFSRHAGAYARARPHYPPALFEYLASLCLQRNLAWDCATGNGQAARGLADRFEKVIGTDASAEQLADFKCFLRARGHRRQRMQVYRLGKEVDRKVYRFGNGRALVGKEMLLELEELNGPRELRFRFVPEDAPVEAQAPKKSDASPVASNPPNVEAPIKEAMTGDDRS